MKPVALPPGRARLATKPAPTGSATVANTIGTCGSPAATPLSADGAGGEDDVGRERDQFRRVVCECRSRLAAAQRYSIRTLRPIVQPSCCQPLQERRDASLRFRIVLGEPA